MNKLDKCFRNYLNDSSVVDITVEDPSDNFIRQEIFFSLIFCRGVYFTEKSSYENHFFLTIFFSQIFKNQFPPRKYIHPCIF